MDDSDQMLSRLVVQQRLLASIIIAGLVAGIANWELQRVRAGVEKLHLYWQADGGLVVGSTSDGPFVVTHLITPRVEAGRQAVARLPIPIVIMESGPYPISAEELDRLTWLGKRTREKAPAPTRGSPLRALYYKPLKSEPAEQSSDSQGLPSY